MRIFKKQGHFNELLETYYIFLECFQGKFENIDNNVKYFNKMIKISLFLGKYQDANDIWMKNLNASSNHEKKHNYFRFKIKIETEKVKEYVEDLENLKLDDEEKLKIKVKLLERPMCEENLVLLIGAERYKSLIEGNIGRKDRWLVEHIVEILGSKGFESFSTFIESLKIFGNCSIFLNELCRANIQLSVMLIIIKSFHKIENTVTLNPIFFTIPKFTNPKMIEIYLKVSQLFLKTLSFNDYSAAIKRLGTILKLKPPIPFETKLKYYKLKSKYNQISGFFQKSLNSIRKLSDLLYKTQPIPLHLLKYFTFYLHYLSKSSNFQKSQELLQHIGSSLSEVSEKSAFKFAKLKEICLNLPHFQPLIIYPNESIIQLQTTLTIIIQDPEKLPKFFPLFSLLIKHTSCYENLVEIFSASQKFFTLHNPTLNLSIFLFTVESCKLFIKISEYTTNNLIEPFLDLQEMINFSFNALNTCENFLTAKNLKNCLLYSKVLKLLARIYIVTQEFESASEYIEESFNIVAENVGLKDLETGKVFKKSGDLKLYQWKCAQVTGDCTSSGLLEESREFYVMAEKILEERGREKEFRLAKVRIVRAECCVNLMDFQSAKEMIKKAEDYFERFKNFYVSEVRWLQRLKEYLL